MRIFRALVRGRFAELDDSLRDRLLAEAGAHDVFAAAFTREGTLTYDSALDAFTFRFEVREDGDDAAGKAESRAREMAAEQLRERGIGHTELRVAMTDMGDVWRGRERAQPAPPSLQKHRDGTLGS